MFADVGVGFFTAFAQRLHMVFGPLLHGLHIERYKTDLLRYLACDPSRDDGVAVEPFFVVFVALRVELGTGCCDLPTYPVCVLDDEPDERQTRFTVDVIHVVFDELLRDVGERTLGKVFGQLNLKEAQLRGFDTITHWQFRYALNDAVVAGDEAVLEPLTADRSKLIAGLNTNSAMQTLDSNSKPAIGIFMSCFTQVYVVLHSGPKIIIKKGW